MKPYEIIEGGYYQAGQHVFKVIRKYFQGHKNTYTLFDIEQMVSYKYFDMDGVEILNYGVHDSNIKTFCSIVKRRVKPKYEHKHNKVGTR
jgi:hypothetical protein